MKLTHHTKSFLLVISNPSLFSGHLHPPLCQILWNSPHEFLSEPFRHVKSFSMAASSDYVVSKGQIVGVGILIGYFAKQDEARKALRELARQGFRRTALVHKGTGRRSSYCRPIPLAPCPRSNPGCLSVRGDCRNGRSAPALAAVFFSLEHFYIPDVDPGMCHNRRPGSSTMATTLPLWC